MAENEKDIVDILFRVINEKLIKKEDGSFIFNGNKTSLSVSRHWNGKIDTDVLEEICKHFEKDIVSKIPHALLIIKDRFSIKIDIKKDNKQIIKKTSLMEKQIDLYNAFKTLFFPTMRERIVKFGYSNPEWIYYSSKRSGIKDFSEETSNARDIRFIKKEGWILRRIEGTATDFLRADIAEYIKDLKFQTPIPLHAITLPQENLSRENLRLKHPNRKKGFHTYEFYSHEQQVNFVKKLYEDFIKYYPTIVEKNFSRLKKSFATYSNFPIKITIKTQRSVNSFGREDLWYFCSFEKLMEGLQSQVELFENEFGEYDERTHFRAFEKPFSGLLHLNHVPISGNRFGSSNFTFRDLSQKNSLPYIFTIIAEELDEIIEKFNDDSIFDEIKPYQNPVENWIKMILDAEKKGNEDDFIELKREPTESSSGDGSGNDIYGQINAFENGKGGHIFLGADEKKNGISKIVGLNSYLSNKSMTLDKLKRDIQIKCWNYLKKDPRIEANEYQGKILIRIKIVSNNGRISWFHTKEGYDIAYIRLDGKKRKLSGREISERLKKDNL